ncbi:protocadherin Fat 4-like [Glandiceps talaboti]
MYANSGTTDGLIELSRALDMESLASYDYRYTLLVRVQDRASINDRLTTTATIYIDITGNNENSPVFTTMPTSNTVQIYENQALATYVTVTQATDADAGPQGYVTHEIVDGDDDPSKFRIDVVSGEVTLVRELDYEARNIYGLTIAAVDGDEFSPMTSSATLTVSVLNINDEIPTFEETAYETSMVETTSTGTTLVTLSCTDDDTLPSGVTYSIVQGNSVGKFSLSANTNTEKPAVVLANTIDYDTESSSYYLVVRAFDNGSPRLTGSTIVVIHVTGANEADPVFGSPVPDPVQVFEDTAHGTHLFTITAKDADLGDDGVLTYEITDGDDDNAFSVDSESGFVSLHGNLDYDAMATNTYYDLTFQATDGGNPVRTGTAVVQVNIVDVNDNYPVCSSASYSDSKDETISDIDTVVTLSCSDADGSTNGYNILTYDILSGNTENTFEISSTGLISLRSGKTLDYESENRIFELVILVSDSAPVTPKTLRIPVTVHVSPINEHSPQYKSPGPSYNLQYSEDTAIGDLIIALLVDDQDASDHEHGQFTFDITQPANHPFSIDQNSGEVRLSQTLDYESQDNYDLRIVVKDGGSLANTASVSITVSDANDHSPTCVVTSYGTSLAEDTSVGTTVVDIDCSDGDSVAYGYGVLTYDIIQSPKEKFSISNGELVLAENLDYETDTEHSIIVTVSDQGLIPLSITVPISVQVTPINEATPTFPSTYTTLLAEDAGVGTSVGVVYAVDTDSPSHAHGIIRYSITPGDANHHFQIDPNNGLVTTSATLDREDTASFSLRIRAEDGGDPAKSDETMLTVTITDVNDNPPVCSSVSFVLNIEETTAVSTTLATFDCSDLDASYGVLSYAISSGNSQYFTIVGNEMRLSDGLDFEIDTVHYLSVIVNDNGPDPLSVLIPVTVNVVPVNEFSPVFSAASDISVSVPEDTPKGMVMAIPIASDGDSSNNAHGHISYIFASGNEAGDFLIDPISAEIMLVSDLDRETLSQYTLQVKATDGVLDGAGTPNEAFRNVIVTVTDVNDNAPVCDSHYFDLSLDEVTTVSTNFLTVTCTDNEDDATNDNNVIRYEMNSDGNDDTTFAIDTISGQITLENPLEYDSETVPKSYSLEVFATDQGSPKLTATVMLSIDVTPSNEHSPSFIQSVYDIDVYEDTESGTSLLQVSATDADYGDDGLVKYTMPTHGMFHLQSDTGWLVLISQLDYDDVSSRTHNLILTAVDQPTNPTNTLRADVTVIINVLDVNDNDPLPSPSRYTVTYSENIPPNTNIEQLIVTDLDDGQNGMDGVSYTIVDGNTDEAFAIDNTGRIENVKSLDWEVTQDYSLVIEIKDGGSPQRSSLALVGVTVTPYNEFTPVFSENEYSFSLPENTIPGTTVFQVHSYDEDLGPDLNFEGIVYSIVSSADFSIDTFTGEISVTCNLDRESTPIYSLVVRAVDNGHLTKKTATVTLAISVTDFNDNTPICNPSVYHESISESTPASSSIVQISCTDADEGSNAVLSYELVDGLASDHPFEVESTGKVITRDANYLNYESTNMFELSVYVTDGGDNPLTTIATVFVEIEPYNDHAPRFTSSAWYDAEVSEDADIGINVTQVVAVDADVGSDGEIVYVIVGGNDDGKFHIDPADGWIKVRDELDRESVPTYRLIIEAHDHGVNGGQLTGTATVAITVTDINDNAPSCSPSLYTTSVAENSLMSTNIVQLSCTDADDGNNAFLLYEIEPTTDPDEHFFIDNTGLITVHYGLDYETQTKHVLSVKVSDAGTVSLITTIAVIIEIIGVNEYGPEFDLPTYTVYVDESVPATSSIAVLSATDYDKEDDIGEPLGMESGDITDAQLTASSFYDSNHTPQRARLYQPSEGSFAGAWATAVNDNNQWIKVDLGRQREITGFVTQGREDADQWVTQYKISYSDDNSNWVYYKDDSGNDWVFDGNTDRYTTVPNMIDEHFLARYVRIYPVGYYGHTSMRMEIYGIKEESQLIYTILTGNAEEKFYLHMQSGEVRTSGPLDREDTALYELEILVMDRGIPERTGTSTLFVNLNDVNDNEPVCTPMVYTAMVTENSPRDTMVLDQITCNDRDIDVNALLQYTIIDGNADSLFYIEPNSGYLYVDSPPDFENQVYLHLVVNVADSGVPSLNTYVNISVEIIGVNEFAPQFSQTDYPVSLNENDDIGLEFLQVVASDSDRSGHEDGRYSYAIIDGNGEGKFSIGALSGILELKKKLDRETTAGYLLVVRVTDEGGLYNDSTVTITVDDHNDNEPVFDTRIHEVVVSESAHIGTMVLKFGCSDRDENMNAQLSYELTGGDENDNFQVTSSREIEVKNSLDYETMREFVITLTARDAGADPLSSNASVVVHIEPVNEHAPIFTAMSSSTVIWREDTTLGTVIKQVMATDSDWSGQVHGIPRYSIVSGNIGNRFDVQEASGNVILIAPLDRENTDTYSLVIRASDNLEGDTPVLTDDVTFSVSVSDANDNYPLFDPEVYSVSVLEGAAYGTVVVPITSTDADAAGSNSNHQYTIADGNSNGEFYISGATLRISAVGLDRERSTNYKLLVRAEDFGSPRLSSTATVFVEVLSENDNPPTFNIGLSTVEIYENVALGSKVFDANATDADVGTHNSFEYFITDGNDQFYSETFLIGKTSGIVRIGAPLDRERQENYTLEITARDSDSLFATKTLRVTVLDKNDNTPQMTKQVYTATIREDIAIATSVLTVMATDEDSGENSRIAYTIFGQDVNFVTIGIHSGQIYTQNEIDYEQKKILSFFVRATDYGDPQLSSIASNIQIFVTDTNDNAPVFSPKVYYASIGEEVPRITSIMPVFAYDVDEGNGGLVSYSRIGGDPLNQFAVVPFNGWLFTLSTLDRETTDYYELVIQATDNTSPFLTDQAIVYVTIEDYNDNAPVFAHDIFYATIHENVANGTHIIAISASDADIDENAEISFYIIEGDDDESFYLDPNTGDISTIKDLDRETTPTFNLTIAACDGGIPTLNSTAFVFIQLRDLNDNFAIFDQSFYHFEVNEDIVVGTLLGNITAHDTDNGTNSELRYRIIGGNELDHYVIDDVTGDFKSNMLLDRETMEEYNLTVEVYDLGNIRLRNNVTVTVTLLDVNDNNPNFDLALYEFVIAENLAVNSLVFNLSATDADINDNARLRYKFHSFTALQNYLKIDRDTGVVSVNIPCDRETEDYFEILANVRDYGSPSRLYRWITIYVNISDVNDNTPVLNPSFYSVELRHDSSSLDTLTTVSAYDNDIDTNAELSFYLTQPSDVFEVDLKTGDVRKSNSESLQLDAKYLSYVAVKDAGTPHLTSDEGVVRIDTFNPNILVDIHLAMTLEEFYLVRELFISKLSIVFPPGRVGISEVNEQTTGIQSNKRRLLSG